MRKRYLARSAPGSFDHRVEGAAGRAHGGVDVGGAGLGDLGEHLLGRRVDGLERPPSSGVDELGRR